MKYKHTINLVNGNKLVITNDFEIMKFSSYEYAVYLDIRDNSTQKIYRIPMTALIAIESEEMR